jgi:hypothetical protein
LNSALNFRKPNFESRTAIVLTIESHNDLHFSNLIPLPSIGSEVFKTIKLLIEVPQHDFWEIFVFSAKKYFFVGVNLGFFGKGFVAKLP